MVLIGKRSYAMYLIHVLVVNFIEAITNRLHFARWYIVVPASYICSFLGATVLFYLVETPCISRGRRISKSLQAKLLSRRGESESISRPGRTSHPPEVAALPVKPLKREEYGVPGAFKGDWTETVSVSRPDY